MIKIIWDWNGTLLNDLQLSFACITRLQKENGIAPFRHPDEYRAVFGFPIRDYYEKAGFDFSILDWEKTGARFMDLYLEGFDQAGLQTDCIEALRLAKELGMDSFILSATRQDLLKRQIGRFEQLRPFLSGVYGIGDIYASSKEGAGRQLMESMLEWDQVWMIGDTQHDREVADTLGIRFIPYGNGHQLPFEAKGEKPANSLLEVVKRVYEGSCHSV